VRLDTVDELEQAEEPFALNGLQHHQVGQALLDAADLPQALEKLALSGQLPMAAFGQRLATELQTKTQVVLDRRSDWLQRYPNALPAQSIDLTVGDAHLTGTLTGLYGSDLGYLQIDQRVGAVLEGKKDEQTARCHIVVGLWLQHLAACASALPLTSVQLGLDGEVVFQPMTAADARAMLEKLVLAYQAAWQRPLPAACKTGWAYLQAVRQAERLAEDKPDKTPKDPHEVAEAVFDGAYQSGERAESAYLARAFESYDALEAELPAWAECLYGNMARQLQAPASEDTQP